MAARVSTSPRIQRSSQSRHAGSANRALKCSATSCVHAVPSKSIKTERTRGTTRGYRSAAARLLLRAVHDRAACEVLVERYRHLLQDGDIRTCDHPGARIRSFEQRDGDRVRAVGQGDVVEDGAGLDAAPESDRDGPIVGADGCRIEPDRPDARHARPRDDRLGRRPKWFGAWRLTGLVGHRRTGALPRGDGTALLVRRAGDRWSSADDAARIASAEAERAVVAVRVLDYAGCARAGRLWRLLRSRRRCSGGRVGGGDRQRGDGRNGGDESAERLTHHVSFRWRTLGGGVPWAGGHLVQIGRRPGPCGSRSRTATTGPMPSKTALPQQEVLP